jgi:WhiB family redox-sensing transcriptional regulator
MQWHEAATCRSVDPELWFPECQGQQWEAVMICSQCPVQRECMTASFDQQEEFGVWGGLTSWKRVDLLHKYRKKPYSDRPGFIDRLLEQVDTEIADRVAHQEEVNDRRLERNARNNQRIRDELKSRGLNSRGKK